MWVEPLSSPLDLRSSFDEAPYLCCRPKLSLIVIARLDEGLSQVCGLHRVTGAFVETCIRFSPSLGKELAVDIIRMGMLLADRCPHGL
jgi:hypothetical protein